VPRLILLLLLAACTGGPRVPAPEVRAAVVRLDSALDRAAALHADGRSREAQAAWRDAHGVWDSAVGPGLEDRLDRLDVVALELHLSRIRAQLDDPSGDPVVEIERFRAALASPIAALPAPR
jgi:hypothetical protein